jgi:hypothetical protein
MFAVLLTAAAAYRAAAEIGTERPMLALLVVLVALCGAVAVFVARRTTRGGGKSIELMSGAWTVLMYLGLGAAPVVFAWLR